MAAPKNDKIKRKRYTTPKGESLFAHVAHVDYGTDQYPNEKGQFCISLALDEDAATTLRNMLADEVAEAQAAAEAKFAELKPASRTKLGEMKFNDLGTEEYDKDENLTGRVLFRFKTAAFYENRQGVKTQRKVPLFDSMTQPVKLTDEPGNGSIIRVSFTAAPYFVDGQGMGGLTLYLDAMQILKLNKYGERSASDYGFGEEEGDFSAEDVVDTASDSSATTPANAEPISEDDVPF